MARQSPMVDDQSNPLVGKPNQIVRYSEKTPNWYKNNAEFYIRNSWTMTSAGSATSDLGMTRLYEIYNNKFPLEWFSHLTNPLNAKDKKHQRFPAKIRPINILRTSIDLLINELSQRPFVVQVVNQGDKAYNDFQDGLMKKVQENLSMHFMSKLQQIAAEEEIPGIEEMIPEDQEVPLPEQVKSRYYGTYKDNQAIGAQHWISRALDDIQFNRKKTLMMKDYLIAGFAHSYKDIVNGKFEYERVSPIELKYAISPNEIFVNKAAWAVRRYYMTTADVVERYHQSLDTETVKRIYARTATNMTIPFSGQLFYNFLKDNINAAKDLVPVYHVTWRGKKAVKILSYPDPLTGMMEQMEVDEDYPVNEELGESAVIEWRDEVYQCTRIFEDIYCEYGPTVVQNGNLPYNGRAFSNTHASNISVLQMGLPFQLMVMIINWTIERAIAKSKGKILLIDINAVPSHGDWDEEKFFYYGEALGYFLMDRDKRKVDKSWNQYQVLDMTMYEHIKQLIDLQNHYRQLWDDVLGITMPRKGQTYASSSPTNNERSLFQSNIITDNIFTSFEELLAEDLNDMLEHSKILNAEGTNGLYQTSMFDHVLLNIDPVEYCSAMLGIIVKTSAKEQRKLDELKAYIQEFVQNGVAPSTILEIILAENVAELRTTLKKIEATQAEMEQAAAENEQAGKEALLESQQQWALFENALKEALINTEWDRKDQNTMIKGEYDIVSFTKSEDNNADGVPDASAIADRVLERFKIMQQERKNMQEASLRQRDQMLKEKELDTKERIANKKNDTDLKREKIKARTALKNKTSGEK